MTCVARVIIAGLAGEAMTSNDKPGSSLDELALSQFIVLNAAVKRNDDDAKRLWHEEVWTWQSPSCARTPSRSFRSCSTYTETKACRV